MMCADALADECRTEAQGRLPKMFLVLTPAEVWAGGQISMVTADPRRAEEHAAAMHGVTAYLFIHNDYRTR